ncbi:hypothetical protein [Amycolatopsis aidingensis]|uniref:hypothetical protein n=1 Tax=Amycolatopsis aidingensis TaxID=2842453 RepID=UPI001C0BD312|nr:hypothetical protein [Amycolatopsis aidingensis]
MRTITPWLLRLRGERGDDNVAAVFTWAGLLLIVWAVFQVVVVFLGRNVALDAARDGLNIARLPPVDTAAAIETARTHTREATTGWLSNVDATATSDGQHVTVTVTADAASLIPGVRISVRHTATGPIERLQP